MLGHIVPLDFAVTSPFLRNQLESAMKRRLPLWVLLLLAFVVSGCARRYKPKKVSKSQREARIKKLLTGLKSGLGGDSGGGFGDGGGSPFRPRKQHPPEPKEFPIGPEDKKYVDYFAKYNEPELIKRLDHKNPAVRESALARIRRAFRYGDKKPPAKLLPKAMAMLDDKSSAVRQEAAGLLGLYEADAKAAIPKLVKLLNHHQMGVVAASAKALIAMKTLVDPHIPKVIEALKNDDCGYHGAVAELLGTFGPKAKAAVPEIVKRMNQGWSSTEYGKAIGLIGEAAPLIEALKSNKSSQRRAGAHGIGYLNPTPEAAVDALIGMSNDSDKWVRQETATALGNVRPTTKKAVLALGKLLKDSEPNTQQAAAVALGKINPQLDAAVAPLLAATKSPHENVRNAATASLANFKTSLRPRVLAALRLYGDNSWDARKVLEKEPKKTLPILIAVVNDKTQDKVLRMNALLSLANYKIRQVDEKSVKSTAQQRHDDPKEDADVRFFAAVSIATSNYGLRNDFHELYVKTLEQATDPYVRRVAADKIDALQYSKDEALVKRAVAALIKQLSTRDEHILEEACSSLGSLGQRAESAIPALCRVVADKSSKKRYYAASALGSIDTSGRRSIPTMLGAVDKDLWAYQITSPVVRIIKRVRENAKGKPNYDFDRRIVIQTGYKWLRNKKETHGAELLGALGPDAAETVPALLATLKPKKDSHHDEVIQALGEIGPKAHSAIPTLLTYSRNKNDERRQDAFEALCKIRPPAKQFLPDLIEGLQEKKHQKAALSALPHYAAKGEADKTIPHVIALLSVKDYRTRVAALESIPSFEKQQAKFMPQLLKLLKSRHSYNTGHREALQTIARFGKAGASALPVLRDNIDNSSWYSTTRQEAFKTAVAISADKPENLTFLLKPVDADDPNDEFTKLFAGLGKLRMPIVTKALDDKDQQVRRKALAVMKTSLPAKEYTAILLKSLKNEQSTFRVQAAIALNKRGGYLKESTPVLVAALRNGKSGTNYQLHSAISHAGRLAVPKLVDLLLDSKASPAARKQAGQLLMRQGGNVRPWEGRLKQSLKSNDEIAQLQSALILARWVDDATPLVPVLRKALQSKEVETRTAALSALQNSVFKKQIDQFRPDLLTALSDKRSRIRSSASYALREYGVREADLPKLRKIYEDNNSVYSAILRSLFTYDRKPLPAAMPLAVRMLKDAVKKKDANMADSVAGWLPRFGAGGVEAVIKAVADDKTPTDVRKRLLANLVTAETLTAADKKRLVAVSADKDDAVATLATAILARHGAVASKSLERLLSGLNHKEYRVQAVCTSAVSKLKVKAATVLPALKQKLLANKAKEPSNLSEIYANIGAKQPGTAATLLSLAPSVVRQQRCRWLGQIVAGIGKPALPDLIQALKAGDANSQIAGLAGLRQLGKAQASEAIPHIKPLTKNANKSVARQAVATLALFDTKAAAASISLLTTFDDFDRDARSQAIEALQYLGPEAAPAIPKLLELANSDRRQTYSVLRTIAAIGPKATKALPFVMKQFQSERYGYDATQALAAIGPSAKSAVPELLKQLSNDRKIDGAARALSKIAPKQAAEKIAELFDDDILKYYAVRHAYRFKDHAAILVPRLLAVRKTADPTLRATIDGQFSSIGKAAAPAVPILLAELKTADADTQSRLMRTLGRIAAEPDTVVPAILKIAESTTSDAGRRTVAGALQGFQAEAAPAVPLLVKWLDDKETRASAVRALGAVGTQSKVAVPKLIKLLAEDDDDLQYWTISALGKIGPAASPAVPQIVKVFESSDRSYLRKTAANALWQIDPVAAEKAGAPKPKPAKKP